ncbi:uncharacterized protein LY89DRAFT_692074 [Mollisia scopiformis]|uniref:LYR motif-containing protein Cup1-like N-terminal domain-containing protein n=1 Tax=Mollisia scopiformis TaxID=149040 RepID=A0A132B434_MOLSC|nr:uncharacterized protein LY89DRAFT_692074 [Mollisia scopiformis]KUJ06993.1 hypothetical protein LY89DRAFT_692074 [Mollisia scopiformis]
MAPPEQVLHLYRRLLRATTYIPDSFTRSYIHGFVTSRFKANCTPANLFKPNARALASNRLKKARHWAKIIESASQGHIADLQKVLIQVHGRQGPRKRVLLRQLLQPEEDRLPKDDSALEDLIHKPVADSSLRFERGTKLYALCESQRENHHPEHNKSKLRHLEPKIPAENGWGRPTPRKLAENLRKRWWAESIDKLLPPVPQGEVQRLRDLASGAIPLDEAPPRRAKGTISDLYKAEQKHISGDQLLNVLRSPARTERLGVPKLDFDPSRGLVIAHTEESAPKPFSPSHARSMRRMYSLISQLTPLMIQDEVTKKWIVQWGGRKSKALNGVVSKPSAQHLELFEGLNGVDDSARPLTRRQNNTLKKRERAKLEELEGENRLEL